MWLADNIINSYSINGNGGHWIINPKTRKEKSPEILITQSYWINKEVVDKKFMGINS